MTTFQDSIVRPVGNSDSAGIYGNPEGYTFQDISITGTPGSEASITGFVGNRPSRGLHLKNFDFKEFGNSRTAIRMNGVPFYANDLTMRQGGRIGIELDCGALADVRDSVISNHSKAGIRVRNSAVLLDSVSLSNNEIGVDFNRGASGDVINSDFRDNRKVDIRIHRNVLVGMFDTAATDILNLPYSPNRIEDIDGAWIANRILDTTDVTKKARLITKFVRKFGQKVIETGIWELAKAVLKSAF